MRSLIALLALSALLVLPVHASGTWTQKDLGTVQGLRGVVSVDGRVTAVGNTGNIIASVDGGDVWSVVDQSTSSYWQDIGARGSKIWAVGEGGTMRNSIDGGATWANTTLGVVENLYDVDLSASYGYLVGAGGRVMAYNTNANLWQSLTSPTTVALYRVQDLGNGKLWMVGEQGYLFYGFDGGQSWINKGRIADNDLYGVWFTSSSTGYAVGRNGTFVRTTDAAYSWSSVSVEGLANQHLYDVRAQGDELVVVGDKVILYSADAGATWTFSDYSTQNYRFHNAFFGDEGIWVVGTQDDVKSVMLLFATEVVEEQIVDEPPAEEPAPDEPLAIIEAEPSSLIKLPCIGETDVNDPCRAVYYYASDGKRHAFTNEKVFFSWFDDFDGVINVSADFMSDLSLGANVTYHPGTRMVKFQSVRTVYAVALGGVLRAIASEEVAAALYGANWNQQIDDISDAFYGNYTFGEPITAAEDYDVQAAQASVASLDEHLSLSF